MFSTYVVIANVNRDGSILKLICLNGKLSNDVQPTRAVYDEIFPPTVAITANNQLPRLEKNPYPRTGSSVSHVWFGNESTVEYLRGAEKIWVRTDFSAHPGTELFSGGPDLDEGINLLLGNCDKL